MTYYIYKITCKLSDKIYIGKTVQNPQKRFDSHMSTANRGLYNNYFHNSIRRYGKENFDWSIIASYNNEENAYLAERKHILEYNTLAPNGFNSNGGGKGGMFNPSPDTRNKLSAAKSNYIPWNAGKILSLKRHFSNAKKIARPKGYIIYFSCGRQLMIKELNLFCKSNGYNQGNVSGVLTGRLKQHKDIIKVEKF